MPKEWSDRILISDLADEPALSDELAAMHERVANAPGDEAHDVVLNFSSVTFLNSSNIAQVLKLRAILQEQGRTLMCCSLGDQVWSIMLLTGLDKVLNFAPDPASAIASLQLSEDAEG